LSHNGLLQIVDFNTGNCFPVFVMVKVQKKDDKQLKVLIILNNLILTGFKNLSGL